MCGRQCLTLAPKDIVCACKYSTKIGDEKKDMEPEWRAEYNLGRKYEGSHNIAPTDITPVLVSAKHFDEAEVDGNRRVLVPMMWGMIPFWHKGDYRKHGLTTNNCRLESMLTSKLYSRPFTKGQRCVILCEGFYEWQTTKPVKKSSERAAYFIHAPQSSDDFQIYDKSTWNGENINLLKMAGLYDIWTDSNGDKIYSYSVITFQSNDVLNWLHDRMPAILETEEQISDWLNCGQISNNPALSALKPAKKLCWYQVSNEVNNSRNKSPTCNKPLSKEDIKKLAMIKTPKQSNMLTSWLIKSENKSNIKKEQGENFEIKKEITDSVPVKREKSGKDDESEAKRLKKSE